ncbi:Hypothetical Protein FCC1311_002362 [Hondaea fermentalgiana]|uniref:Deubiquitinating enzyme MINDY-3/4 conserved domain-containing protein n=1 Tax=Hondaea fermentalgiana TaxID=2315210 RepID=A0A2R5G2R1_9STRA|nr:Hypothetical Protein FCC1311_002362 [Hondaea fermentalgiana]|eukprot:GBG24018.1 Hypothetical Protein FCC1311_002362 [Hondaea fermentalgiana]
MADQLQSMTGMSAEEAQGFLDMAGGDVEGAVNLYFSMMGDGGGGGGAGAAGQSGGASGPEYLRDFELTQVLFGGEKPAEAWTQQALDWYENGVGITQVKNGPCGVLAALEALVVASRLERGSAVLDPKEPVSDEEYAHIVSTVIARCTESSGKSEATMCLWRAGAKHESMDTKSVKLDQVETFVHDHMEDYASKGFLEVLLCSCVLSHGVEQTQQEVLMGGGELPLIVGPNQLCTSELLLLLLAGRCVGNVGAYALGGGKVDLEVPSGVGLLSFSELESGIPVHDQLKKPAHPVWVLHGGDHFTVLFSETPLDTYKPPLELWQFNGLPPAGPRMAHITIRGDKEAEPAPEQHQEAYFKPAVGEIEDIVQAHPDDKAAKPEEWQEWRFEAVLAVDDPSVKGPDRPASMPAPVIFTLSSENEPATGEPWRCASCYRTRFETMCFGQNEAGTTVCQSCGQTRADAGYSLWLHFDELPLEWQRKMNRRHAPKLVSLLQTKWPDCTVECNEGKMPSA